MALAPLMHVEGHQLQPELCTGTLAPNREVPECSSKRITPNEGNIEDGNISTIN